MTMGEMQALGAPMDELLGAGFGVKEAPLNRSDLGLDILRDLRESLMCIARAASAPGWIRAALVNNHDETRGIAISVLEVRQLANKTPMIVVAYQADTNASIETSVALTWLRRHQRESSGAMSFIQASAREQELLLHLLDGNAELIDSQRVPRRHKDEAKFKVSFLLPVTGPRSDFLVSVALKSCSHCGRTGKLSSCSRCFTARRVD